MTFFEDLYKINHDINSKIHGDVADYTTIGNVNFTIEGVFDNNYERVDPSSDMVISSNVCVFSCHLENFPDGSEPNENDRLVIKSQDYKVIDPQEDGQGGVKLILHKV